MNFTKNKRIRIFTWHVHGSYLFYLSKGNFDIYIPVTAEKQTGYTGRGRTFPFDANVIEVPVRDLPDLEFDCIIFQTNKNYFEDQYDILSERQRALPAVYLEHDPPWQEPADTLHPLRNEDLTIVHVTHFNQLMWDNGHRRTQVVDHGIVDTGAMCNGDFERGLTVVNHLHQRGRKLGADLFNTVRTHIPIDLVGMGTREYGGLGEVLHPALPAFMSNYRFFFNPIRYTSLGLAVLEAMMCGLPVVALATTEYVTVIKDGFNGFIHTDIKYLEEKMHLLLADKALALELGRNARQTVQERFSIERFAKDWEEVLTSIIERKIPAHETSNSLH